MRIHYIEDNIYFGMRNRLGMSSGGRSLKHRARYAIVTDILETCRAPALQTHVMYKANLSYEGLKNYLSLLLDSGLLRIEEDRDSTRTYLTTKKGLELLGHSHAIEELLGKRK